MHDEEETQVHEDQEQHQEEQDLVVEEDRVEKDEEPNQGGIQEEKGPSKDEAMEEQSGRQ